MQMEVIARHFELSESLRHRTEERLQKLTRFSERIHDARVVVSLEGNRYRAEAVLSANGTRLTSHAEEETDKIALEQVLDRLEVQVRRHKDRLIRKRRRSAAGGPAGPVVEVEEEEEEHGFGFDEGDTADLISEQVGDWAVRMTPVEAAAQLRASRREVLAFTSTATNRPSVIFKRRDGNLGVVDIHPD